MDGDFDVGVDDGLVHDLVAVAVLRSRELLSRDDLRRRRPLEEEERKKGDEREHTVISRKCFVRFARSSLSVVLSASGLRTYPDLPFL